MPSIPIQTGRTSAALAAGVGLILDFSARTRAESALRSAVGTTRLIRSTVGTATNAALYQIRGRLPGGEWFVASFTTSATTDTALRNGLVAAWNANPYLRGIAVASNAGSGVAIDWTSVTPGPTGFEVEILTQPDSALGAPTVITAGALAADAPFGRYLRRTSETRSTGLAYAVVAPLAALAGPTIAHTLTYAASDTWDYNGVIQGPDGSVFSISGDGAVGANLAAFVAALAAALTASLAGAAGVTVTTGTGTVLVSFPVGYTVVTYSAQVTETSTITVVQTAGDAIPDAAIVYDDKSQSPRTIGGDVTGYPGDKPVALLRGGATIAVEAPGAVTSGGLVWVETAAGADLGRPFAAPSLSRFAHPTHRWVQRDSVDTTLALIDTGV
jgi:hypothetical protein